VTTSAIPQEASRTLEEKNLDVKQRIKDRTNRFFPVRRTLETSRMRTARPCAWTARIALPICVIYDHITASGIRVIV